MTTQAAKERTERPVLFSTDMVRAILNGRKTQTRRVIQPQFSQIWGSGCPNQKGFEMSRPGQKWKDAFGIDVDIQDKNGRWTFLFCPFGKVGDLLWVRETFFDHGDGCIEYRADEWIRDMEIKSNWTPSIFMPREASRITLEITNIRVEQIQDISANGVIKEGIKPPMESSKGWTSLPVKSLASNGFGVVWEAAKDFQHLWDSINAKRGFSWESNPFVWVIEFKKL